jgi:hypothetical protein
MAAGTNANSVAVGTWPRLQFAGLFHELSAAVFVQSFSVAARAARPLSITETAAAAANEMYVALRMIHSPGFRC